MDSHYNSTTLLLPMNGSGSTFIDCSPSPIIVTPYGNTTQSATQSKYYGKSGYFDGSGDYLTVPQTNFNLVGINFTIEMWVCPSTVTDTGAALLCTSYVGGYVGYAIAFGNHLNTSSPLASIYFGSYQNSWSGVQTSSVLPVNQWSHVAVVRNGSTVTIYVNGLQVGSGSHETYAPTGPILIGKRWDDYGSNPYFNGYIQDLRITKGVARYTANFTPPFPLAPYISNATTIPLLTPDNIPVIRQVKAVSKTYDKIINGATDATGRYSIAVPDVGNYDVIFYDAGRNGETVLISDVAPGTTDCCPKIYVNKDDEILGDIYYDSVVLALKMNGADNGTTFTDESLAHRTVTAYGNTKTVTAQSKFYGSSAYFDGAGDYLLTASHQDLDLSLADFTVECWVYEITGSYGSILNQRVSGADGWVFTTGGIRGVINGSGFEGALSWTQPSLNTWNHFALTRKSATLRCFINGNLVASRTDVVSFGTGRQYVHVGVANNSGENYFNGYIQDLRITKGVARYTANFIPTQIKLTTQTFISNTGKFVYPVVDQYGNAAAGKEIVAIGRATGNTYNTVTDANGRYSLSVLGLELYDIIIREGGRHGEDLLVSAVEPGDNTKGPEYSQTVARPVKRLSEDPYFEDTVLLMAMNGENTGTAFTDLSKYDRAVTVFGNTKTVTAQSKFYGSSAYFDGAGDYLTVTIPELEASNFTIELWCYLINGGHGQNWARIFHIGTCNCGGSLNLVCELNYSPAIVFAGIWEGVNENRSGTKNSVPNNEWHHYSMVRNGTLISFYFDGVLVGSTTSTTSITQNKLHIGGSSTGENLLGYIQDLRITKGVARYTENFIPPGALYRSDSFFEYIATPEIHTTIQDPHADKVSLLLPMQDGLTDYSGNKRSVIPNGNVVMSSAQSKFYGSSAYFDGDGDYLTILDSELFRFGTGDFTVEAWINIKTIKGAYSTSEPWRNDIAIFGPTTHPTGHFIAFLLNYEHAEPYLWNGSSGYWTTTALNTNVWNHVSWVRKNGYISIFVNGVFCGGTQFTTNVDATTNWVVGGNAWNEPHRYLDGYIQDLRITKGVARYTENFTPPGRLVQTNTLLTNGLGENLISGNTKRWNSSVPVDQVVIREFSSKVTMKTVVPDSSGYWETTVPPGQYDVTYFADGYKPKAEGPIVVT